MSNLGFFTRQNPDVDPRRGLRSMFGNLFRQMPIHERYLHVNPQEGSPLFNGRIPPEIRNEIFILALTEYTTSEYPKNTGYTRPGYTGKRAVSIALLRACRRIYLETYLLPAVSKEHVFWHAPDTGPFGPRFRDRFDFSHEVSYFEKFTTWQLEMVKEIHLFTQMFWLEQTFSSLCKQDFMQGIEKVKITLRRSDWWWNENNYPLGINPKTGDSNVSLMHQEMAAAKKGQGSPWKLTAWGSAFLHLESLKELEIELETSEDKLDELKAIVEHAKTWRFPFRNGMVLSTEGMEVKEGSWSAPFCLWSHRCPSCGSQGLCRGVPVPPPKNCADRTRLRMQNKGPDCYSFTLKWKVANA